MCIQVFSNVSLQSNQLKLSLSEWCSLPLGNEIVKIESDCIQRLLPKRFYRTAIQAGHLPKSLLVDKHAIMVKCDGFEGLGNSDAQVIARAEYLPFPARSIDLLLLPHVLEFSSSPHEVLREISECVVPEGIVVISGFNPYSLLGATRSICKQGRSTMKHARFYPVTRIRDWLALLEFEVVAGEFLFYRPPFSQQKRLDKMLVLEKIGERWWPILGSVYILVAQKKERGIRLKFKGKKSPKLGGRVLSPVAENSISNRQV